MKISAYAQICQSNPSLSNHFDHIANAAAEAAKHDSRLLILPGWSLGCGVHLNHREVREAKQRFQDISAENTISIIAEIYDSYCFFPDNTIAGPFIQRFASGKDVKEEYQVFAEEWTSRKRFIQLHGKNVGLMLCGENNYIANRQKEGNRAYIRYPDLGWSSEYDILVNPTHRLMGNWGKLHKRFEYLSQSGRTVVHVANDDSKSGPPTRSSICIYQDGQCIVMGDFRGYDTSLVVQSPDWWMVTVETAP